MELIRMEVKVRKGSVFEDDIIIEFKKPVFDNEGREIVEVGLSIEEAQKIFGEKFLWKVFEEIAVDTQLDDDVVRKLVNT